MDNGTPALYLDPLLPLHVRADPRAVPVLAGSVSALGVLICSKGGFAVSGGRSLSVEAPGLLWMPLGPSGRKQVDGSLQLRPRDEGRGRLLVIGARLLDQLVVGAFGEPGFCRFLEGLSNAGSAPSGRFLDELAPLLADLAAELHARPPAYRVRARSLLTDVLLSLYRASLVAGEPPATDGFRLATVIDHIELNYAEPLRLEELAAMMETSPSHFSRVFRRETGVPLFEYINRTRIRKACVLLRRADLAITRIALDVGYNNVSFFNRYFRRIMRASPRENMDHGGNMGKNDTEKFLASSPLARRATAEMRIVVRRFTAPLGDIDEATREGSVTVEAAAVCDLVAGDRVLARGNIVEDAGNVFFRATEVVE
ncbi:MAG: helix-turn-helix transcriptional regulator [Spirochaetota bacterium]